MVETGFSQEVESYKQIFRKWTADCKDYLQVGRGVVEAVWL